MSLNHRGVQIFWSPQGIGLVVHVLGVEQDRRELADFYLATARS